MPLRPAAEAGIVDADLQTIRFRHPLIARRSRRAPAWRNAGVSMRRSPTCSATSPTAEHGTAPRCSQASTRTSRVELEEAGARARPRGAVPVAVTAMRRAAELGEPASRSRRLLAAAGLAVELGRRDVVVAAAGRGRAG